MLVSDGLSSGFSLKHLSVVESMRGGWTISFMSFSTYPALYIFDLTAVDKL